MPGYPDAPFPARVFFSCTPEELLVIDQQAMAVLLKGGEADPWLRLRVGPGNALDSAPVKVLEHSAAMVRVECSGGVVEIDFDDETVHKTDSEGLSFAYLGALDQANEGLGWIQAG